MESMVTSSLFDTMCWSIGVVLTALMETSSSVKSFLFSVSCPPPAFGSWCGERLVVDDFASGWLQEIVLFFCLSENPVRSLIHHGNM